MKAIKGTYDIIPGDIELWQKIEAVVRRNMSLYSYSEMRTPIFEETELFARSIGEDTDIVGKEMYTFTDMGGRSLTLRPEGTASIVRAFIEHSLEQKGLPQKLWYMGPMFRQERPQKGRYRQFHQFGVEVIGSNSVLDDIEILALFDGIVEGLGLKERTYSINYIGGVESRQRYKKALVHFLDHVTQNLCEECQRRKVKNPLRVLDCKVEKCRIVIHQSDNFPRMTNYLIDEDKNKYQEILHHLTISGISFIQDDFLVRGLDYYTGSVFELNCVTIGAQSAIMGGGRYDTLVKELGGPDLPAVGFACGIERLILALQNLGAVTETTHNVHVYVISIDKGTEKRSLEYLAEIRKQGYSATMDTTGKSLKAQMKMASRHGAHFTLIVEPDEGVVSARDMKKSSQESMSFGSFIALLKRTVKPQTD